MRFISMCLVVAPMCAALSVASGYARAENPSAGDNANLRVENLVTGSLRIKEAKGAVARLTAAKTSTRPGDELSAARAEVPVSPHVLTDPELPVAPLDNYRLELNNCCGPEEE